MATAAVLPNSVEIGLVQLRVSNLEQSTAFYRDIVGFGVLHQSEHEVQLTADGKKVLLILREIEHARIMGEQSVSGLYHFAILLPDRPSLGLVLRNLIASGVEVGQGDHLVSEALYIQDPDNNGIELYRDRPRDTWQRDAEGHVVMTTDPVDVEGLLSASEGTVWNGLPSGTVIGHVHFHVGDLEQAKAFYIDVVGFELTAYYGRAALFISAGGYHHHIGLNIWAGQGAPAAPSNAAGIDYYTLVLPDEAECEAIVNRVRAGGYSVTYEDGVPIIRDPWNIGTRLVIRGSAAIAGT